MRPLAEQIEAELRPLGSPERAAQAKRYLKSELKHLGVTVPALRIVVVAFLRARPELERADALELARALWKKPIHERRAAAVEVLSLYKKRLLAEDLAVIEDLLRESRGDLVERFPNKLAAVLDRWAKDGDFWLRRAALLSLLLPLRRGEGDFERFCRYAESMLEEKEFFIRKAIGWVLRDASKKTPERVAAWLLPRAARASGLTVREAAKHLPARDRARLLAAHKNGV